MKMLHRAGLVLLGIGILIIFISFGSGIDDSVSNDVGPAAVLSGAVSFLIGVILTFIGIFFDKSTTSLIKFAEVWLVLSGVAWLIMKVFEFPFQPSSRSYAAGEFALGLIFVISTTFLIVFAIRNSLKTFPSKVKHNDLF
jgi:hypothetical protein